MASYWSFPIFCNDNDLLYCEIPYISRNHKNFGKFNTVKTATNTALDRYLHSCAEDICVCSETVFTIRCRPNRTTFKIGTPYLTSEIWDDPMSSKSDQYFSSVIAILYMIWWYIAPRNKGTRQYFGRSNDICSFEGIQIQSVCIKLTQ